MERVTEWVSSLDDHDCQEISAEKLSTDDDLPQWFTQMHLTDTHLEDDRMEIDHNLSSLPITYGTKNEKPRPDFDQQPRRREKCEHEDWQIIQEITGNAPDAIYTPPRQSADSPTSQSTPKINKHNKKLQAKRL